MANAQINIQIIVANCFIPSVIDPPVTSVVIEQDSYIIHMLDIRAYTCNVLQKMCVFDVLYILALYLVKI